MIPHAPTPTRPRETPKRDAKTRTEKFSFDMTTHDKKPPHTRGFFARLLFGKPKHHPAPLPGYIEAMAHGHTVDSNKDLGEFIRRRSMDERGESRRSVDSTPRESASVEDAEEEDATPR